MSQGKQFTAVDLFSGAGGFTDGLEKAKFRVLFALDFNKHAAKAYRYNHPDVTFIEEDIRKVSNRQIMAILERSGEGVDLVVGGPPCQGFSTNGKKDYRDPRNGLFKEYFRVVKALNPKFFVMENVSGMMYMKGPTGRTYAEEIQDTFRRSHYDVAARLLNAADYGVPQLRRRVFFIGNRVGIKPELCFPKATHKPEDYEVVRTFIGNLEKRADRSDKLNHRSMNHSKQVRERMALILPGKRGLPKKFPKGKMHLHRKDYRLAYTRLHYDRPAPTIVPGHSAFPIHPKLNRSLTVREAARLQTFDDSRKFFGNVIARAEQVGNAVPPLMASAVFRRIKPLISASF